MEENDVCSKCRAKKFKDGGVSLVRGIKVFKCVSCGEKSANYADGQTVLCYVCSEKLGKCTMCGNLK